MSGQLSVPDPSQLERQQQWHTGGLADAQAAALQRLKLLQDLGLDTGPVAEAAGLAPLFIPPLCFFLHLVPDTRGDEND